MIVLSVGMPRAGSGWHYNLVHDLMKTTGCADAREIREKYHLQGILTEVNCNIGVLSARRLAMVTSPGVDGEHVCHQGTLGANIQLASFTTPGPAADHVHLPRPRDAMLSAYDYGQRALQKGRPERLFAPDRFPEEPRFHPRIRPHLGKVDEGEGCAHRPLRGPAHELRQRGSAPGPVP